MGQTPYVVAILYLMISFNLVATQVLTPPYFNLAVGRTITATTTCGVEVTEPELFCKLTGASRDRVESPDSDIVIRGQLCDYCNPKNPNQAHPPEQAVDGTERWWQSPPLSRGLENNEVNLTIELGQTFHVAYVFIKMANSPRPGVFALERSTDHGATWKPWQYFADTLSDCNTFFGEEYEYETRITRDDSVICTTEYSKVVPLEGGEIVVSLVNNRPSANNFSYADTLRDWTTATTVRLRLLRTKTLLGHLMAVARQDPTVTRRYFYSVKDISIGGRCVCNGHADVCDKTDPQDPFRLQCRCQHNTCGASCEVCCPGFIQKPWQPATQGDINECEACQCHGHTTECIYDQSVSDQGLSLDIHGNYEGGGVCQNCRDNTEGVNCEKCVFGFYRPAGVPLDDPYACQQCRCDPSYSTGDCEDGTGRCLCKPEYEGEYCDRCSVGYFGYPRCVPCECNYNGTLNNVCEAGGGSCPCKPNYDGRNCDRCAYGFFGFPDCQACACDPRGSYDSVCDDLSGQCTCQQNFGGRDCSECAPGYSGYPNCQSCGCDPAGTTPEICDADNGRCLCQDRFVGRNCDRCSQGYYRYPECIECECNDIGSQANDCDNNGQCICKVNYAGRTCDRCARGYYNYPECLPCNCDNYGSYGVDCDSTTGQCDCRPTFEGLMCNRCKANYYNYPICEECNCNPAGAKEVPGYPLGGCGSASNNGQLCECKERVNGRICDTCKPGYWNLDILNPLGCEDCGCYRPGTLGGQGHCDVVSGQCVCKPYSTTTRCEECMDGTYDLQDHNIFGCKDCNCDAGGAVDPMCDKDSGQCRCRPRINGQQCDRPLATHYFPTLYQHIYEIEDGRTESGGQIRYGFDDKVFPDYSWRGYGILSRIQEEVLVDVDIKKPSLYRVIFRYVSRNPGSVTADITLTPETSVDVQQTSNVIFRPAYNPEFVTVSGDGVISTFVLNPGRWTISLKSLEGLYVDYLVLLPQAYYEGSVLQERVNNPCRVPADSGLCKHYVYVDVSSYSNGRGEDAYIRVNNQRERVRLFDDDQIKTELDTSNMAVMDDQQSEIYLSLPVPNPGKYVLLVQYYSDEEGRSQDLTVDVATTSSRDQGRAMLSGCPYSSLCRHIVVDENGDTKVFDIDGAYASLTLMGTSDINVAINSVIAIPLEDWSIEFIEPKLKCIRRDNNCIETGYVSPPGSVRAELEAGPNADRVATDIPPNIIDTSIKVIKLDGSAPSINLKASVINPGMYTFYVHYIQPYHAGFDVHVNLTANSQMYTGTFLASFCPGVAGCRAIIEFEEGAIEKKMIDLRDLDIVLTFYSDDAMPIWLDYILAVPGSQVRPEVLEMQPLDRSVDFITACGSDNFYIDPSTTGFCRNAVYSITTEYNNGAIGCECDSDGSLSFNCDVFGGQCQCKQHVIGRTCSQCRTGYFGFPDCQPCNCPSGLCDSVSGQCVCPPRVTGANCNVCLPRTFGFDPLIGCEDCNCNPDGVMNNELDCDINTGQCSCKANIAGRRCNQCISGYYAFPSCLQCSCDTKGTVEDICDQQTAQCLCKENVEGPQCSQCKPSTYYLEDRNYKGCTTCFCFGTTNKCASSNYRRSQIREIKGWDLSNYNSPSLRRRGGSWEARIKQEDILDPQEALFWISPEDYLGNRVTSYGGKLIYTVTFYIPIGEPSSGLVRPDVRLQGNNITLAHISPEQPVEGQPLTVEVDMVETNFVHEESGALATREQFMMLLANLEELHIRGSYYSVVDKVIISDIQLDVAVADGTGAMARNVEQCQCPPNYVGTSCEECAPGFHRSKTGPFLGVCVPCQCNGRADTCDSVTGKCLNCRDGFDGDQCESCKQGYYEDPYTRRCEICACPLPVESHNFAATCEVHSTGVVIRCECLPGYTGPKCDSCDRGYFGDPQAPAGICNPCPCNGNIDVNDPRSCDPLNGDCLICRNNATGNNCEYCKEWHWGDAISNKDCQPCNCNQVGSERCDSNTGLCLCKPNIVGPTCDTCAPQTYGFDSGNGCSECDCGLGAYGNDCDVITGQCSCRPGVTGRACDQCAAGYWNYGPSGCEKCSCDFEGSTTCDAATGQCTCLPGVTGPDCDQCMDKWVLIPDAGCQECDSCVHLLIDDVELLDHNVTILISELKDVSVGVLALRRLENINTTANNLRPLVDNLIQNPDTDVLDPIRQELIDISNQADEIGNKAGRVMRESDLIENDAADVREEAENLDMVIQMGVDAANDAVKYVQDVLQDIVNNAQRENIDQLVRQAEDILQQLKDRDFTDAEVDANTELDKAKEILAKAKDLQDLAMTQLNRTRDMASRMDGIDDKFKDLINNSRHSLEDSNQATRLDASNQRLIDAIKDMLDQIQDIQDSSRMMLDMASDMLSQARDFLDDARDAYRDVETESSRLSQATDNLQKFVDGLNTDQLRPLVDEATEHAYKLKNQADELDDLLQDTRESAEAALKAVNSYKAIVTAINDAFNASRVAVDSAMTALDSSNGVAEQARISKEKSLELLEKAQNVKDKVTDTLFPRLDAAKDAVDSIDDSNQKSEDGLNEINTMLDMLPEGGYGDRANAAADKAMEAQMKAEESAEKITNIIDRLPEDLDKVAQMPVDIDEANNGIEQAKAKIDEVLDLIPTATDLMDNLAIKGEQVDKVGKDLTLNLEELREKIQLARGEAERIKVGVTFYPNVTLQVRNPDNMEHSGAYSQIQLFVKTKERNGLLYYIGPDGVDGQAKTDDFMALEIVDGRVVFKYELGGGVTTVENQKDVSDGLWHEVIVERNSKAATITVRTEDEADVIQEGEADGTYSVLDLSPDTMKFYVGGVPTSAELQGRLDSLRFTGQIEDMKYDGFPVGLWDFAKGENNYVGCFIRDALPVEPANGFKFDGDGYVVLDIERFRPSRSTIVRLNFKTYAPDGLLLYMGKEWDFLSVEIKAGKVLFQYELGSGTAVLESTDTYNDGKWHTLLANRRNKGGLLKIDGVSAASGNSLGANTELSVTDEIFIGGYRGEGKTDKVTDEGFYGCIKDLQLGATARDMNKNKAAKGVLPGCVEKGRVATFVEEAANSYIALQSINIDRDYYMTMKIKTTRRDGLLFYVANEDQTNAFSISLLDGKVVVINNAGDADVVPLSSEKDIYADGRWHYITVHKNGRSLQLDINDSEMVKSRVGSKRVTATDTNMFYGGVRPGYALNDKNVGSSTSFVGCIGDVTVNGDFVNFGQPISTEGTSLGGCPIPDPEPSTPPLPTLPPPEWVTNKPGETNPQQDECALPLRPDDKEGGTYFGSSPDSRQEFDSLPGTYRIKADFSVEFKTDEEYGVIMYASGDKNADYLTFFMSEGKVGFAYNCGDGPLELLSPKAYNDGKWHSAIFDRDGTDGRLVIDGDEVATGKSPRTSRSINISPPFYVGGVPLNLIDTINNAGDLSRDQAAGFKGCLRNFQLDGVDIGEPERMVNTESCASKETGTFFHEDGGYVKFADNFKVGLDLQLDIDIKPRTMNGVILSVASESRQGDYMVLQLVDGQVVFTVDNGKGELISTFTPPISNGLCDGKWHTIKMSKAKNVVTLYVDDQYVLPGIGEPGVSSTDTNDPLYIGGVPTRHRGIKTQEQYVGCIRNFRLRKDPANGDWESQNIAQGEVTGRVSLNSCPLT